VSHLSAHQCGTSLAHSLNLQGQKHGLVAYLEAVAEEAQYRGSRLGAEDLAHLAGLWRELGKFSQSFQTYILDPKHDWRYRLERDHASIGAIYAVQVLSPETASLVGWVIAGHHGGLADQGNLQERLCHPPHQRHAASIVSIAARHLPGLKPKVPPQLPDFLSRAGPVA
jgi:CRISPR-associated endonuclease/helicase Cas3